MSTARRRPYRIGLTGNIATGKSCVGHMLVDCGATHIDADKVAHAVMAPDGAAYAAIVAEFGQAILAADNCIDRKKLGALVFASPPAMRRLEQLVHPPTAAEIEHRIAHSPTAVVVVEAIKLLESLLLNTYHAIWVTTCSAALQCARLEQTRGLSHADALLRIRAQAPQAEKLARADVIIDTTDTLAATRQQVLKAWRSISQAERAP